MNWTDTHLNVLGPGFGGFRRQAILMLVLLLAGTAWSQKGDTASGLIRLDPEPVAARDRNFVPWGRPLVDGAIDALFVAPGYTMLDIVALNRHLDMRATLVPLVGRNRLDVTGERPEDGATPSLAPYLEMASDVIVMANIDFSLLSDADQHVLIERLEEGVGLVLVIFGESVPKKLGDYLDAHTVAENSSAVTRGLDLDGAESTLFDVSLFAGDIARAAVVRYRGAVPESHCLVPFMKEEPELESHRYDAFLALMTRSLLWAADREPTLRITGIVDVGPRGPDLREIPPHLPDQYIQRMRDTVVVPPLHPFVFQFNRKTTEKYRLRLRVRYPKRGLARTLTLEENIPKGLQSYRVAVPMGSGSALLDFWLMTKSGVADWYTQPITLTRWPEVADVRFSKSAVQVNDTVSVSAFIRKDFYRPRSIDVLVRAVDSFDRVVAERRTSVSREGGWVALELALVDLLAPALKVELFAANARGHRIVRWHEERAGYAFARLTVTNPPVSSSFKWICDVPDSDEINARRYRQRLVDAGVDASWASPRGDLGRAPRFMQFEAQTNSVDSMLSYSRWTPWYAVLNGYDGIAMGPAFGTASRSVPLPALQPDGSETQWFAELARTLAVLRGGFDAVIRNSIRDDFQHISEGFFVEKGKPEAGVFDGEQMAFRYSKARILAFLAAPGSGKKTQRMNLKFKKSLHVYDMLGHESVSRNGKIALDLAPGDVGLLSILPYPVTRLEVQVPARVYAGRRLPISIEVKTRDALPGDHVVRLDFGRRGRAPLKYYSCNLICVDGRGTTYVPLAINEIPGPYTLRVRDALTGVETVKTIQVVSPRSG